MQQPSTQPKHIFGILGHPVTQSLSPLLHNWGFGLFGFPGAYFSFDKRPDELAAFMRAVRDLPVTGLSVTIPHKETIIPYLDELTPRARAVGAVNTVYWRDNALVGENTDVAGFLGPLRAFAGPGFQAALVLGAGGAARAVLAGLAEMKVQKIVLCARRVEQAEELARTLSGGASCQAEGWPVDDGAWRDLLASLGRCLVINTTPVGMKGKAEGLSPIPAGAWPRGKDAGLAYDLVYNPAQTRFLLDAAECGWQTQEGLDFFAIQGQAQFRLWIGHELPLNESRALLRQELNRRA